MKQDKFKVYLFLKLRQYQTDLKISDIEIIESDETIKEKINRNRILKTDHEKI